MYPLEIRDTDRLYLLNLQLQHWIWKPKKKTKKKAQCWPNPGIEGSSGSEAEPCSTDWFLTPWISWLQLQGWAWRHHIQWVCHKPCTATAHGRPTLLCMGLSHAHRPFWDCDWVRGHWSHDFLTMYIYQFSWELTSLSLKINYDTLVHFLSSLWPGDWGASL